MDAPGRDHDVETYRIATSASAAVGRRLLAPLVVLFVVLVLLGSLTGSVRVGLGLGILGTAAFASVLTRRLRAGIATTVVRISPEGAELLDGQGFGFRLRWPDVSEVGQVGTVLASQPLVPVDLARRASEGGPGGIGLIGRGERVDPEPSSLPRYLRKRIESLPRGPAPSLAPIAIPLGAIDPDWQTGAIGAALRRHRPDLLPDPDALRQS